MKKKYKKNQKLYKNYDVIVKKADEEKHTLEAVFSTDDVDRHGEVVKQKWDLKNFKNNPVILNSHNYGDAMEVIGKATKIGMSKGKLTGKIEFAVKENPKAEIIFNLYSGGFLNAFSVGFIVKKWDEKTGDILESELLEVSAVSVPANAMALAKAKGIKVEKLKALRTDNWDEGDNEIRYKVRDIELFKNLTKTMIRKKTPKIGAMVGEVAGEDVSIQSLFFSKSEGWTIDDAKKWVSTNEETLESKISIEKQKELQSDGWDEGDNEIRYKVRDIGLFDINTLKKSILKKDTPKINSIIGKTIKEGETAVQSLFFAKSEGWTIDDARKWVSVNNEELESKKTVKEIIDKVIMEKVAQRERALKKVLKALNFIHIETSIAQSAEEAQKVEIKRSVNKIVRKLLEIKK